MAAPPLLETDNPNLDFLRAFAVLAVLVAHTSYTVWGETASIFGAHPWEVGRIGVSIFFVHTSLVLFGSMSRAGAMDRIALYQFYAKRAFRIYPLAIICVVLVVLLDLPPSPSHPEARPHDALTVLSNILLIQNLTYAESVIGALWSLPIEVQMYVALPFLHWIGRTSSSPSRALAGVLAICTSAAFVGQSSLPGVSRLSVLPWAPCFAAGFIAWVGLGRVQSRRPAWMWPGAMLIAMLCFYPFGYEGFKEPARSWLMCIVLGLTIPYFRDLSSPWIVAPSRVVARYSFGIYLVHQSVLFFAFVLAGDLAPFWQWTIFLGGLTATSMAAFHWIEQPGIRLGRKFASWLVTVSPDGLSPSRECQ